MSKFVVAGALALTFLAGAARAEEPEAKQGYRRLGLKLDAGAPDGAALSVVGRPLEFLRLEFGGATTTAAPGIRGAVAVFYPAVVSPVLSLEAGHMFQGDYTTGLFSSLGNKLSPSEKSLLKNADYTFYNLHAGLEFGSPNRFQFFIHGGMSRVTAQTHGLQDFVQAKVAGDGKPPDTSVTVPQEGNVRAWAPSAKLGFILYLF